jgi:hypothetical protein
MALMLQEARIQDDAVRLADSKVHDFDLDERNDLTDVISISADGSSMHSSPASDKIEYYVSLYFDHFHPHWPFIFKKAFPTRSEPTVLVLATAMIGMWITGEARLQRQAWMIHARLHIMLESQIVCSKEAQRIGSNFRYPADMTSLEYVVRLKSTKWPTKPCSLAPGHISDNSPVQHFHPRGTQPLGF